METFENVTVSVSCGRVEREEPRSAISEAVKREKFSLLSRLSAAKENFWDQGTTKTNPFLKSFNQSVVYFSAKLNVGNKVRLSLLKRTTNDHVNIYGGKFKFLINGVSH